MSPRCCRADQARFEEATYRTTRWLDRCMKANRNPDKQNLFPIVQGGFDVALRETSMQQVCEGGPGSWLRQPATGGRVRGCCQHGSMHTTYTCGN